METYYDNYLHSLIGIFKYIIRKHNLLRNNIVGTSYHILLYSIHFTRIIQRTKHNDLGD